jgi:protocatechuate 3,4-dioxygenase beta subunit
MSDVVLTASGIYFSGGPKLKTLPLSLCLYIALFSLSIEHSPFKQKKENSENCVTCGRQTSPDDRGNIKGKVVNGKGVGMADIVVYSDPIDRDITWIPSVTTDRKGRFIFEGLRSGKYSLYAGKDLLGYPESDSRFYGDIRSVVVVELNKQETANNILLRLPKKVARLSGKIVDASNNAPVKWAIVKIRRADTPGRVLSIGADKNGRFEELIPLDTVIVEAAPSEDSKYKPNSLQVSARKMGERKNVIIKLEPVKSDTPK